MGAIELLADAAGLQHAHIDSDADVELRTQLGGDSQGAAVRNERLHSVRVAQIGRVRERGVAPVARACLQTERVPAVARTESRAGERSERKTNRNPLTHDSHPLHRNFDDALAARNRNGVSDNDGLWLARRAFALERNRVRGAVARAVARTFGVPGLGTGRQPRRPAGQKRRKAVLDAVAPIVLRHCLRTSVGDGRAHLILCGCALHNDEGLRAVAQDDDVLAEAGAGLRADLGRTLAEIYHVKLADPRALRISHHLGGNGRAGDGLPYDLGGRGGGRDDREDSGEQETGHGGSGAGAAKD